MTGGCGFVGSALVRRLLAESCEVVVVDDLSRGAVENLGPARSAVTVIERDVRDGLDELFGSFQPEVVFHLAAMHFIPDCDADPARCLQVNVEGTRAVLAATAALPDRPAVVLASSAAVYAPLDGPLSEERDGLGPVDVYGYSKRWAEELAADFAARTGAAVGIARLFNVYGPGETNDHFIPSLICQLQAGDVVRLGNLSSRRDYVFVLDVVEALFLLAQECRKGHSATVNVGSGRAYAGHEVVAALAGLTPVRPDLAPVTDLTRLRRVDRPLLLADTALAAKLLDWTPRTSLVDGLRAAWDRPVGAGVSLS
ncbi:MAG TPA: NAD-dependent epimerase/dehydratase family protein [Trebonia sp.]|nr:NAD-dependent epimerase/dehydratase family protein [Trebonia sp.]